MNKHILIMDSNEEEAKDFILGAEKATNTIWTVEVHENNKKYGLKRYLNFFVVAWVFILHRKRYFNATVVCWQQFYGITIAFLCRLLHLNKKFNLVIMTFIYKPKIGLAGKLFEWFVAYAANSKYVDMIICTSHSEIELYSKKFRLPLERFRFVKWGIHDISVNINESNDIEKNKFIFTAGRSNRDYEYLVREVTKNTDYQLEIVCDKYHNEHTEKVVVHNDLFDNDMLKLMKKAWCVVIALKDKRIASGQLVLLQAMCLSKPVIITSSQGVTDDYVIDGYNGLVVEKAEKAVAKALLRLETEPHFYESLCENARLEYSRYYTSFHLGENIGKEINSLT